MSALYGRALADILPRGTTGYQARALFGSMTKALSQAYQTLVEYQSTGAIGVIMPTLALVKFSVTKDAIAEAKQYLDSINNMLQKYYPQMPESHTKLTDLQFNLLKTAISGTSVAVKTIDDLFSTPWGVELADDIGTTAGTIAAWIAKNTARVAGSAIGAFLGQAWWVILLGAGGVTAYVLVQRRIAKRILP